MPSLVDVGDKASLLSLGPALDSCSRSINARWTENHFFSNITLSSNEDCFTKYSLVSFAACGTRALIVRSITLPADGTAKLAANLSITDSLVVVEVTYTGSGQA